jgi:hypothetical protein
LEEAMLMVHRLPLYDEHSCALGVVTMTYLDEICTRTEPTMEKVREEMKLKSQGWVPHSDVPGSLDDAFHLWDAVSGFFDMNERESVLLTKTH